MLTDGKPSGMWCSQFDMVSRRAEICLDMYVTSIDYVSVIKSKNECRHLSFQDTIASVCLAQHCRGPDPEDKLFFSVPNIDQIMMSKNRHWSLGWPEI